MTCKGLSDISKWTSCNCNSSHVTLVTHVAYGTLGLLLFCYYYFKVINFQVFKVNHLSAAEQCMDEILKWEVEILSADETYIGGPRGSDRQRERGGRTERHQETVFCATRLQWMRGNIWFGGVEGIRGLLTQLTALSLCQHHPFSSLSLRQLPVYLSRRHPGQASTCDQEWRRSGFFISRAGESALFPNCFVLFFFF